MDAWRAGAGATKDGATDAMNDANTDRDQTDEQILIYEVSDEALEAATANGNPTLLNGSYCFTCAGSGRTGTG